VVTPCVQFSDLRDLRLQSLELHVGPSGWVSESAGTLQVTASEQHAHSPNLETAVFVHYLAPRNSLTSTGRSG
jgi:hypothetical protein